MEENQNMLKNDTLGLLDLSNILSQPQVQSIIQEPEFYFQKGQDALKRWMNLSVSDELKDRLINLSKDYKKIQEEAAKQNDLKKILDLLFEVIAYCDNHAKDKNMLNQYEDKRALADAFVRMNSWTEKLIQYKFLPEEVGDGSTQNAFDYLLDPEHNSTILSEGHRKLISENLIYKVYHAKMFVEELKSFFADYNLQVANLQNYTHLLMCIVYSFQDQWKDDVIGLMASDGTGWQDRYGQEMASFDAGIIWNSKRPSGTVKTLKFLKEIIVKGGSFNLYYCSGGVITHKANIIDLVENQKELNQKQWTQKQSVYEYESDFSNYKDGKKSAKIVFLAASLEKTSSIPISEFQFYGNYSIPRQDNLSPIKKEASTMGILNSNNFRQIIEAVKVEIKRDEKIKELFNFGNTESHYVWISDSLGLIGDNVCHYEISNDKPTGVFTVDVHFEGKNSSEYQQFDSILKNLPDELKRFPFRKKGDSIRYGSGISSDHPDLIKELKNQLCYIEENIGDSLRKIITNSKPEQNGYIKENKSSLNQILFGPPGTGKTYNTINKAIAIANPVFDLKNQPRKDIKQEFERLMKEGQVVFTTFHQSMGYEDFIEGIKPLKPDEKDGFVKYDVIPGIFKKLCRKAETPPNLSFDIAYQKLLADLEVKGEIELKTVKEYFKILTSKDGEDLSVKSDSYISNITKEGLAYVSKSQRYAGIWGQYYKAIFQYIKDNYGYKPSENKEVKNHVLIIDEINRGNVSQIFGELITLIEEDKRLGKDEALEVTLPYSKESFGVPSNLYIIGTMNTADRSVEAIDTALRRRFSFVEMPPKYDFKELQYEFVGIKGAEILQTLNRRIEKLLDKDHQLGHSFFMLKESSEVEEKLINTLYENIIPLLQEYFFGDFGKIGLVLGKGFVKMKIWDKKSDSFADFDYQSSSEFDDREVFGIIDYRTAITDYKIKIKDKEVSMDFQKAIKLLMKLDIE